MTSRHSYHWHVFFDAPCSLRRHSPVTNNQAAAHAAQAACAAAWLFVGDWRVASGDVGL